MSAPIKEDTPGSKLAMFSAMSNKTSKVERAIALGFAASSLFATAKKVRNTVRARFMYTITVNNQDSIYPDVHGWIIDNMPTIKQHAVIAQSTDSTSDGMARIVDCDVNGYTPPVGLRFLFDGKQEQDVVIGGHTIKVSVTSENDTMMQRKKDCVVFTCQGLAARQAVSNLLSKIASERQTGQRVPRLYIASRWNEWSRRDDITMRALDTVVLGAGVKERLLHDFQEFRDHEQDFIRMGMPYHRGYLFYGPPGSGKTSIAKALASHFNMDVYYMPLSDLETDNSLITMVSRVPAGAMLLLEDIDIAHAATDRDDDSKAVTLSGMLNAIDGVATPHGLVVVMTTNNRDVLDEALIRPGRVDLEMNIDYVNADQLSHIFDTFTGKWIHPADWGEVRRNNMSSATVVGEILKNIDNTQDAIDSIMRMLA